MKASNFKLRLPTEQTPQEAYQDIIKIRNWWRGYYDEEFTDDTETPLRLGITIVSFPQVLPVIMKI